jgi:hypothetical protein
LHWYKNKAYLKHYMNMVMTSNWEGYLDFDMFYFFVQGDFISTLLF